MVNHQVICMGSTNCGKTTLLKILENNDGKQTGTIEGSTRVLIKTLPTIGVNHFDIVLRNLRSEIRLTVKEYGGVLAPLWTTYLKQQNLRTTSILYMVDCSDPTKLPETSVHLIDILRELTLRQCPCKVLIVYSKIDLLSPSGSDFVGDCAPFDNRTVNECRQLLRIHHLKTFCRPNVSISEALFSAVNGQGLPFITYWLQNAAT